MSDQNLFLDFLSRDKAMRNQDTALTPGRVNARVGVTAQPVAQTDFGALARRYGVPPAVVENDPDTWRQRAASDDAQRQIDLAPKLGQWLGGDPQRAKMTHDSLDAMAGVEHAISAVFPKNGTDADKLRYWKEHNPGQGSITTPPTTAQVVVAKIRKAMDSLYSSSQTSDVQLYGIAANAMGNLFGDNSAIAQHLRQRAGEKQREAQKYSQANKGGEWEQAIYGGIENLVPALVALGAGVASGGSGSVVVGTAGSLLTAGAMTQGQSYITARQAGLSHEEAQAFGQRDAAVEVATELLPTARIFHALKVGTPAMDKLKDWAIATIEEQVGEQFATHLQDLNQWASIDANKGKTLDQYFAERPDAAFRTAVATAIMSGTIGGIIGAANLAQRRRAPAEDAAQKSQRTEALLTGLKELAEAAPIAKRDVSTFESWVRSAAEGTQATDVYIDARTLVETLQQSGLTEPEIVAALPSIRTELPTALLANGDVRIPIEEFAARSGELGQSLIQHLRIDPNDMSTSEAQTFMQSAQDEFQKETEKAFAEINADDQFRQSTERVADAVYEKLNQAGRFTPDTNRAYASLHAAFFARLASDLGTTPEEAAARYPLLIQSEGVGEGPGVMDQITPEQARELSTPLDLPSDPLFAEAVRNTNGAEITDEGLHIQLVRVQKVEQEGGQSIRTGVFYLPKGSPNLRYYKGDSTAYGGTEKFEGPTLLRRPLFVKGATGGKAPEAAYDIINGKGAAKKLERDVMAVVTSQHILKKDGLHEENVENFLGAHGIERWRAYDIIRNSNKGNQLRYALQEIAIAHAVREAGYDAVVGYSKGKKGALISEVFDVREQTYPAHGMDSEIHESYFQGQPLPATIEVDGKQRSTVNSNGQPLAQTEEGVRAFWDWFGDSKVVDEQGRPLVVYHGTAADFDIFKNSPSTRHGHGRQMPGIYLTPDPSIAEAYARTAANARDASTEINGAAILPLFVKMENPARFADPEDFAGADVGALKNQGYDGAVRYAPNGGRLLEIVVFDPAQVKSIHNRGTFDPNDPRILYQNGQPVFYSALQRTVESSKQAKAPASQWKSILQNAPGVKAEELEWSGILDLFDEDPKRVWTRDELVQLLDAGGIKVDEVVLGDESGFTDDQIEAEAAAGGFPLFQRKGNPRGQASFATDITSTPSIITLLRGADLSTFLHESGHFFLEVLMHVAAQPDAPQRVVDDMNAFLKWTGVESMGQWSKMTINEKRPHHERFARGVEAFLYEGNAPSLELKSLFQRFRGWLLTVYRSLTQLNVELTPEIRGVFNRMLASDQAIREAEQQVGYEPILTEKPEGMADEEWEAYQRLGADATSEAVTDLERRSLRDMRYAGKAAGRELKRLQREIRTMRETMRAEVEADLAREPVYRAQEFMKKGLLDGEPVEGPTKMLISEVEALYEDRPKLYVDEVKRALGYGMLAKDGIHPEQIAELFGFTSADHMIQDLMLAEPFKKAVETEIDTRMLERYGDLTSEKALQDAVDQAIHNDVRGRFVATEFAALSKAPGKPRVMAAAARSLAEKAVSRLKVRNLRPAQYEAAERRAAKAAAEASAKGDIALAASEKRNQLINFYGAKASHDALADVDKMVRYFKKFENKGTRQNLDVGYLDQIDKLLERFDLRKSVTNKQIDRRKSLDAWIKQQQEMGFEPVISAELADEASRVHYREMTVEEMRGLRDAIKNIEYLARLKKRLLLAKDKRDFADAVNDVAGAIRANAYKNVAEIIGAKSWWERVQSGVHDFFAMHRKMANWAHVMDGNKMGGPVWERFIRPMNERGAWEASAKAKATADLGALFDRLKGQNLNKRSFVPAIGKSLSLQDRLMVALNMGNEGNLQRLMDGERWEQDKLNAVLEPLTQDHWAFVQAVWDYLDSFYPDVAAKEVRVSGVAPQKVEAVPFERQLADGSTVQMRGGYFPIKYDPDRSSKAEADTAAEVLQQMTQGRYTAAQTRRGHTKARAEQVDRPVRKDFGVIFEHVNQVIHDLAWHEYLIDANRLLRAVDIDTAIREAHGPETLRWMRKALEDIAIGEMPARDWLEAAANSLRVGASVSTMAWNFLTALQQPLGLVSAAGRIGPRWVLKGIKNIMGDAVHMENTARWVYERSEVMRNRATTQQREIAEVRNKVSDKSPLRKAIAKTLSIAPGVEGDAVIDAVQNSYFFFITKAQLIADLPTWVGQYEKSMAAGETEDRAAALADQAVLDTQGGGQIKDMAGVQRGPVYLKLFTNFYSFFNATLNMNADRIAQLRREGITDIPAFAADMLLINVLPSVLGTLIYTLLLGDDDDRDIEGFIKKAGGDLIGYMMSQIVGLREFSGLATGGDTTYAGPAGTRFFKETTNLANQVRQGEADEAAFRAANKTAGILFKYPSTAVDRFVRGSAALEQGEAGPLAPVVGPPVDR